MQYKCHKTVFVFCPFTNPRVATLIRTEGGKLFQRVLLVASPALRHEPDAGAAHRIHCCCGREIKEKVLPELTGPSGAFF